MLNRKGQLGIGLMAFLVILIVSAIIGGFLWPYSISTLGHFFGKSVHVSFGKGALLGLCPVIGQLSIPVAVIVWIIHLII